MLADSDTRWKWGALTARRIAPAAALHGYVLRGRATPTPRQLAETGVEPGELAGFTEVTTAEFLADLGRRHAGRPDRSGGFDGGSEPGEGRGAAPAAGPAPGGEPFDALVLSCVGGTVQAMLHGLARAWRSAPHRPVVVTGYVGVVYEKLTDGLLLRHGADMVLANSPYDARRFRAVYDGVRAPSGAVTECALPFLQDGRPYDPGPAERGERPYRVVFAVQPSVPGGRADRGYLLRRAIEHARRHPEREVVVKLRSKPGEHTTHVEELPYQRLAQRTRAQQPANFRLAYGNMGAVLDGTDLLVTVSSTAALESLHRGVPTAVLTDLGVREPLGNHYFVGSGCLASWDELDAGHRPTPDPAWLADQGIGPAAAGAGENEDGDGDGDGGAFAPARGRLRALLAQAHTDGLPALSPYYTEATAPGYLPGVLARHGLDAKGEPLAAQPAGGPAAQLLDGPRTLLRSTARGAYRAGVQRVAPVIRRWGQL